MTAARAFALPAGLILAWLVFSVPGGVGVLDLLAGGAAAGAGILAAAGWPGLQERARRVLELADDLLGEAEEGAAPAWTEVEDPGPEGDPDQLDPVAADEALGALLQSVADEAGGIRVVVWEVDREADRIAPIHCLGPRPHDRTAGGDPLAWAIEERCALRLDPAPDWSRGAVAAAPVDRHRVLTVETEAGAPPEPEGVRHAARLLGPFLALHDQQAHAHAATARLDRVVRFLRSVPAEDDPHRMPDGLARAGLEIVGGEGALVASWAREGGIVLAGAGTGGGPAAGTEFGPSDGDLANAARTDSVIRRRPEDPNPPPLASSAERWDRPGPPYRVTIPLVQPDGGTRGVLAVWGRTPPAEQGVALMAALGPLFALHLAQASDLALYRDRATVDALTDLPNRGSLDERMAEERARFHRYRRSTAVMVIDLDHFKRINDSWGHDAGDAVLRRVAQVLRANVREADFAARFGGEELVILMPETMLRAAIEAAERVREAIAAALIDHDGQRIPVTASIGVAACPECVDDPDALFAAADQALYASKEGGRNQVTAAALRGAAAGPGG